MLIQRLTLIVVLILAAGVSGLACTCAEPTVEEGLRSSDVAFFGTLLEVADPDASTRAVFEVERILKGAAPGNVEVDTSQACDSDMFVGGSGRTYLVLAEKFQGRVILRSCSGTRPLTATCAIDVYVHRREFLETAVVTAICVSLSLSIGYLVSYVRKRKR